MAGRRIIRSILVVTVPTLIAVVIALLLTQWHKPTRVELALTVDRVALSVAPVVDDEGPATLIDFGRMRAVRGDRAARVTFAPGSLEIADEARFDLKANRFPEDAWRPLAVTGEVALEPATGSAGVTSAVTLQPAVAADPGIIKLVRAHAGADAVIELGREKTGARTWLTLALDVTPAEVDLVFPARFLVFADYMRLTGIQDPTAASDTLSLRAGSDTNTAVRIQGSARGLVLQLEPVGPVTALLAEGQIPVSAVDFTHQGPSGERRSSLIGPGTLSYPELPAMGSVHLAAGEFVNLDRLSKARIESLGVGKAGGKVGLNLTLDAVASRVRFGTPEQPQDARLTWFDWLWHQPMLRTLFAIVVWLFPTTLAGYKLWFELPHRQPNRNSAPKVPGPNPPARRRPWPARRSARTRRR